MKSFFILLFSVLLMSCSSLKKHGSVNNFDEIYFGSGGGFTGIINTYMINSEGYIYNANDTSRKEVKRIDFKTLKKVSKRFRKLDFSKLDTDDKGNMTYFIDVKTEEGKHKVTWSDQTDAPELKAFFNTLANTLK